MIRMLIVGYCMGFRPERRLCEEVHLNLGIAGSVGLGSMPRSRTTRPSRRTGMAASATATCSARCSRPLWRAAWGEGLVGGEGFAIDASMIKADANRQRSSPDAEYL
jgi:transposase